MGNLHLVGWVMGESTRPTRSLTKINHPLVLVRSKESPFSALKGRCGGWKVKVYGFSEEYPEICENIVLEKIATLLEREEHLASQTIVNEWARLIGFVALVLGVHFSWYFMSRMSILVQTEGWSRLVLFCIKSIKRHISVTNYSFFLAGERWQSGERCHCGGPRWWEQSQGEETTRPD